MSDIEGTFTGVWDRDHYFILGEDGEPRPVGVLVWAAWFEANPSARVVLRETVRRGVDVSTVFLSTDHGYYGGAPVLWETMVFGGPFDEQQRRYTSKLAALEGHAATVRLIECDRTAPRKTKKVLRKVRQFGARLNYQEQRRLARVLHRILWP